MPEPYSAKKKKCKYFTYNSNSSPYNVLWKGAITLVLAGRPVTLATSKMELFMKIVNKAFQPLTAATKSSILDIAEILDPLLVFIGLLFIWFTFCFRSKRSLCYMPLTKLAILEFCHKLYFS